MKAVACHDVYDLHQGDEIEIVGFAYGTGGTCAVYVDRDYLKEVPIHALRVVPEPDPREEAIAEHNRRWIEAAEQTRRAPLLTGYRSDPLLQAGPVFQQPARPDPDRPVGR